MVDTDEGTVKSAPPSSEGDGLDPPVLRANSSGRLFGEDIGDSGREMQDGGGGGGGDDDDDLEETYSDEEQPQSGPLSLTSKPKSIVETNRSRSVPLPIPRVQGRPPRVPHQGLPQQSSFHASTDHTIPIHDRSDSAGESSFISGLTDMTPDDAKRERTVSFDEHFFTGKDRAVPNNSIIQPLLESNTNPTSPSSQNQIIETKLTLAEIVNPAESEAEAHILRSLEQRDKNAHANASNAAIFPNLNDHATEAFMEHLHAQQQQQQQPHSTSTLPSPSPRDDHASPGTAPRSPGSGSRESREQDPSRRRANTASSKHLEENVSSASRPKSSSTRKSQRSLRRTESAAGLASAGGGGGVDSTLYGLATTMRNLHHEANRQQMESMDDEHIDHHRQATHQIGHPLASFTEPPRTGTDQLVAHAALVFRGKLKKKDDHISEPSLIAESVSDPKKTDSMVMEGEDEDASLSDMELGIDATAPATADEKQCKKGKKRKGLFGKGSIVHASFAKRVYHNAVGTAMNDWEKFNEFVGEKRKTAFSYAKTILFWVFIPFLLVACLLFYALGNPLMLTGASISWFLLFIGVRQVITFSMAKAMELFVIDFLALKTRALLRLMGPLLTLIIVQSKGWPSTAFWWSIFDLMMLSGTNPFARHWMFYQSAIKVFSEENPSGYMTDGVWNYRILIAALVVSMVVAIKRFAVGLYLGGRTYWNYGSKLAGVIHKMIIISQVAGLARKFEREKARGGVDKYGRSQAYGWSFRGFGDDEDGLPEDDEMEDELRQRLMSVDKEKQGDDQKDEKNNFGFSSQDANNLNSSEKIKLSELLDRWEEPPEEQKVGKISIQAILQFKQTLAFMDLRYPFSASFGLANSRESCLTSAQEVFHLLQTKSKGFADPNEPLHFKTLTELARDEDGEMDESRVKDIVRVFRPDRTGNLTMIDFLRSVDLVYKELRLLRAAIHNSSQIDNAFEAIINVAFYFLVGCIVLASWEINPLTLFLSLSSVIVAFSFAVGSASAKYFEGLMFILGRTPYDVGDRISINQPDEPPVLDGVATWFVEDVTLYCTTLRLGATNEVATIANSNMASARIINAARSKRALITVKLRFGIDTPYGKLQIFKDTLEAFVKERPRQWLNCSGIRATQVMADMGYIEYAILLQHRESWQQIGIILQSKAELMNYSLEVQKKLGIKYQQPATPVNLTVNNPTDLHAMMMSPTGNPTVGVDLLPRSPSDRRPIHRPMPSQDLRDIAAMFDKPGGSPS